MTRTKKRAGTILRKFDRVNNLGRIKPAASRHLNTGFQSCMPARSVCYEHYVSLAGFHEHCGHVNTSFHRNFRFVEFSGG